MSDITCIYHGNCADGYGAYMAVLHHHNYTGVFGFAGNYGQPTPPDDRIVDKIVIIVDFSYPRDVLLDMASKAKSLIVIDHHKSAQEDLSGGVWPENVTIHFDMEHSGAMLAWLWFNEANPPQLIRHIEDRDLWRFKLSGTKEVMAAVFSYPYNVMDWRELMFERDINDLRIEGQALRRDMTKRINALLEQYSYMGTFAGFNVPMLNAPHFYASEAGSIMCEHHHFAVVYSYSGDYVHVSLRSKDDGEDVSVIANQFGGGGHRNAAGLRITAEEAFTMLAEVPIND